MLDYWFALSASVPFYKSTSFRFFFLPLSISHAPPPGSPHTPTQGTTLTDCYHADYSCCGLSCLFGLEALWSRDCHYSVSLQCLAEESCFDQSSGTRVISMINKVSVWTHIREYQEYTRTKTALACRMMETYSYTCEISITRRPCNKTAS